MDSIDRRGALALITAAALAGCAAAREQGGSDFGRDLAAIEAKAQGRLGACVVDTATGRRFGWREAERFAHCSSFKLSLAAMVLRGGRRGSWQLAERLRWSQAELLPNSPVTGARVAAGLTLEELAHGTLVTSDNTAANLLLRRLGGPQALTGFWRETGDGVSRLDHYEPELNVVLPGSEANTTTPAAMAATVAALVTGEVLDPRDRATLVRWMAEVETGKRRLRAGFPGDWLAGDKTGTGTDPRSTTYVDLAYGGPPGRAPLIVAAYFQPKVHAEGIDPAAEAVLADVGRLCARAIVS